MTITVKGVPDPIREGLRQGWKVHNASAMTEDASIECDVVIVGTGAGGGTAAEILTQAGLSVVMLEEGPLRSSDDFKMREADAFRDLYQEGGARTTVDGAFTLVQGRAVGGSTTVNWTSSFRTPEQTLNHWTSVHGVKGVSPDELAPWFERAEKRLNVAPWTVQANNNNDVIRVGCEKLGWSWQVIPRNVNGCWNLGYCGMGCPTNAKQSMLVTTIPSALQAGATLYHRARVHSLMMEKDAVKGVVVTAMQENGVTPTGKRLFVRARHTVLAGGTINTPGILLRSKVPDPYELVGKRTMIHPVTATFGLFDHAIEGWAGAPQSIYSDQFQWKDGATGPVGFKLEVMPMHPAFIAGLLGTHGQRHLEQMQALGNLNGAIAILRDGFIEDSPGGSVLLHDDGSPTLDYEMTPAIADGLRRGMLAMAEMQFAAGAKKVRTMQLGTSEYLDWPAVRSAIQSYSIEKFRTGVGAAHFMGGCAMGEDPKSSVVSSMGKYHHLGQLSILDGSIFPTSIGANPQLSIYGLVTKLATHLANELVPATAQRPTRLSVSMV